MLAQSLPIPKSLRIPYLPSPCFNKQIYANNISGTAALTRSGFKPLKATVFDRCVQWRKEPPHEAEYTPAKALHPNSTPAADTRLSETSFVAARFLECYMKAAGSFKAAPPNDFRQFATSHQSSASKQSSAASSTGGKPSRTAKLLKEAGGPQSMSRLKSQTASSLGVDAAEARATIAQHPLTGNPIESYRKDGKGISTSQELKESNLPEWAKSKDVPTEVKLIGYLTVLPTSIGCCAVHAFAELGNAELARQLMSWDIHYTALLLVFMSATHVGMQMVHFGAPRLKKNKSFSESFRLATALPSIFFAVGASASSFLAGPSALYYLFGGFIGLIAIDYSAHNRSLTPTWFFRHRIRMIGLICSALAILLVSDCQALQGKKISILNKCRNSDALPY